MQITKIIFIILIFLTAGCQSVFGVDMDILAVHRRINPPPSGATGCLELRFLNTNWTQANILFCCEALEIVKDDQRSNFATINYEWRRPDKSVVLRGCYDVSERSLSLSHGGYASLYIPIMLPSPRGTYSLSVSFENERLERISRTHASIGPGYVFFKANAKKDITL